MMFVLLVRSLRSKLHNMFRSPMGLEMELGGQQRAPLNQGFAGAEVTARSYED